MKQCNRCKKEKDAQYFLPVPKETESNAVCIFCWQEYYQNLASFFTKICKEESPVASLSFVNEETWQQVSSITCREKQVSSLSEVSNEAKQQRAVLSCQQRIRGQLHLEFRCFENKECSFQAFAMETANGFTWQLLSSHQCIDNGGLEKVLQELQACQNFTTKLSSILPQSAQDEVNSWSKDYREISAVYKREQDLLHSLEDKSIEKVWGLPCRFRRARGKENIKPQPEDLKRLEELFIEAKVDNSVIEYIQAKFQVAEESSYFQQRGYMLLLLISCRENLLQCLYKRIQIVLYASSLIESGMFFLAYKRLNPTVLRNHIWMVLLFLLAQQSFQGKHPFPCPGTFAPFDSDDPEFYPSLEKLPAELFVPEEK